MSLHSPIHAAITTLLRAAEEGVQPAAAILSMFSRRASLFTEQPKPIRSRSPLPMQSASSGVMPRSSSMLASVASVFHSGAAFVLSIPRRASAAIAARKDREASLLERQELFNTFIEGQDAGTGLVDEHERFIFVNPAAERLFGVGPGKLIGRNLSEFSLPDGFEIIMQQTSKRRQGEKGAYDYTIIRADGVRRILRVFATPRTNLLGKYAGAFGVFTDVTEQRRAEYELRESEEKFSKIFSSNPDPVMLVTLESGVISEVNESFLHTTCYARDSVIGHTLMELRLICNEDDRRKLRAIIRTQGMIRNFECWFRKKSGIIGIALISAEIVTVGGTDRILSVAKDITERKESEDRITATLREKEVMLKEIHHRVKNNLQVISSLLRLQSRAVTDPQMIEFLKESQNRVKSMSMIHEKLYQSKDLAHVDFAEYLKVLTSSLIRTYGGGEATLEIHVAGVQLGIDTAIPCGLIVNELISNSLKYAFIAVNGAVGNKKCITVKMENIGGGDLVLIVGDNGVGLPANFNFETSTTLGMRLVAILTKQINGTLTIDRRGGTSFTIHIPHR